MKRNPYRGQFRARELALARDVAKARRGKFRRRNTGFASRLRMCLISNGKR